jgi:acyl dehydratase
MADAEALAQGLRERIGFEGAPFTHTVEKGALIKFAKAVGETSRVYLDEAYAKTTRFGGLIASPTWVSVYPPEVMSGVLVRDLPLTRFLHTDDIAETYGVIRAGDEITAVAKYADVFVRKGRLGQMLFQAGDVLLTNQHKTLVAKVRVVAVNFE